MFFILFWFCFLFYFGFVFYFIFVLFLFYFGFVSILFCFLLFLCLAQPFLKVEGTIQGLHLLPARSRVWTGLVGVLFVVL